MSSYASLGNTLANFDMPALVPAAVAGLQELWESSSWQQMVGQDGLSSSSSSSGEGGGSPVLQYPKLDHESMAAPGAGVKRGLLEALLQLSMPQEVRAAMSAVCCTARLCGVTGCSSAIGPYCVAGMHAVLNCAESCRSVLTYDALGCSMCCVLLHVLDDVVGYACSVKSCFELYCAAV